MERTLVEQLLAKYFEGTTTLSEENQLKDYFSSQTIAPHLMQYQALFGYFKAEKSVQMEEKIPLQKRKFQRNFINYFARKTVMHICSFLWQFMRKIMKCIQHLD